MNSELEALKVNDTWIITDLPPGKTPIGCKWVFKIKYNAMEALNDTKHALLPKGLPKLRALISLITITYVAIASSQNWFLHQLDVQNAFLHGTLEEEVYMALPPGITSTKPNQVMKLLKSIYGLKQSSRQWFAASLCNFLILKGYIQSTSDYSLFIKHDAHSFTALLVYVDDLILAGNDLQEITSIKSELHNRFKIKDLGIGYLKYFLGLETARSKTRIHICQRKYTLDILSECGFLASKPVNTPMTKGTHLTQQGGIHLADPASYRRLIGKLLYLTTTRPNISFVCNS